MGAESQEQGCVGEGGWGRVLVGGTENAGHLRRAHVSKGGEKGHTGEREGPCRTEFSSPASCFTDGETEGQRETAFDSFSQPAIPSFNTYLLSPQLCTKATLFCPQSAHNAAFALCLTRSWHAGSTRLPLSQVWHMVGVSYRSGTSLSKVTPEDHTTTGTTTIFPSPYQHA